MISGNAEGPRTELGAGPSGGCPRGVPDGSGRESYRKELIWMVSVRPGPTPIAEIGAPDISSRAFT
ncbi:hypothetical protein GCM10009663_33320 [Kitasatospora arboriphila]|uniref:Uncharacterized protein n=1 Tax=Kitasatospora arboriphila TaxID=258052 RepID=A0ABN1TI64_9ACTN